MFTKLKSARNSSILLILQSMLFAIWGLSGCSPSADSPDEEEAVVAISLQTDWYAQPEHGGFYQALMKGFYKEAGLDVTIIQGNPTDVNRQKVATGNVDFGVSRIDDIISAYDRGLPLIAVGAYMQRTPLALMLHAENPVNSFAELNGKTVKAQPGALFLGFIQNKYQVAPNIVPHDFGMSQFINDTSKSLIQQCYMTSEPYYMAKENIAVKTLGLSEGGYRTFRVMYTRQKFLEDHPDIVKKFIEASWRGWKDYLENDPTPAHTRIAELNPKMTPDFMRWTRQTLIDKQLVTGDPDQGEFFNKMDSSRVEAMMQLLLDLEMISKRHNHTDFVTWAYSPQN